MNSELLKKMKRRRESMGISGHGLSQLTKITPPTIYRVEGGKVPSVFTCSIILEKLGARVKTQLVLGFLNTKIKKLNLSTQKIAGMTKLSYGTIQKLMAGQPPTIKTCCRLAKELDMPLEDFIEWPSSKTVSSKNKTINLENAPQTKEDCAVPREHSLKQAI